MSFIEKIKAPGFWRKVSLITIPFFIVLVIFSLLMSDASAFFSFDLETISELNFKDGKWKSFLGIKIVVSFFYGVLMATKKSK